MELLLQEVGFELPKLFEGVLVCVVLAHQLVEVLR